MTEYIGYKDTTGDGLCNMGLTDEEVIRCRGLRAQHLQQWRLVLLSAAQGVWRPYIHRILANA